MFGLGVQEIAIIMGLCILIFGAKKLPEIGAGAGKAIRDFQLTIQGKQVDVEPEKPKRKRRAVKPKPKPALTGEETTHADVPAPVSQDLQEPEPVPVPVYGSDAGVDNPRGETGETPPDSAA